MRDHNYDPIDHEPRCDRCNEAMVWEDAVDCGRVGCHNVLCEECAHQGHELCERCEEDKEAEEETSK